MNSPYMGKFRVSQIQHSTHDGLDLVGIDSKEIHSTVNGSVIYAGWESAANHAQGFGQYVKIKRAGTNEVYYYGHLSEIRVNTGDTVRITDIIGIEGSTGKSTGSHCHYCMRIGGVKGQQSNISTISGIPNACGTYDDGYLAKLSQATEQAAACCELKAGDRVKIQAGATDYNGRALAKFVYSCTFDVISCKGDRIVIGRNGAVTAAMHVDALLLA